MKIKINNMKNSKLTFNNFEFSISWLIFNYISINNDFAYLKRTLNILNVAHVRFTSIIKNIKKTKNKKTYESSYNKQTVTNRLRLHIFVDVPEIRVSIKCTIQETAQLLGN